MESKKFGPIDAPESEKPKCKLIGANGNVFVIISAVTTALNKAGMKAKAEEFTKKALQSESYDAVLALTMNYVDIY